jgi:oxygen-independent coproporphyrinogen-3 oxidase
MTALYIHWPFCKKKCPYCDFNSHVRAAIDVAQWQRALLNEMQHMAHIAETSPITSIFFGGGTPSLMPASLVEALIAGAEAIFGIEAHAEITLEANPTSYEAARFVDYRTAGVNRLSLGIQALNDKDLQFLGREHSAQEALQVLEQVQRHFARYSFDLIYARPKQTLQAWEQELQRALMLAGGHLSLYQLTIEQETPFARLYAKGNFTLPDDETAIALYHLTETLCSAHGLYAYEVSNYAAPSHQSIHNLTYWRGGDYIGVGAGAHGRIRTEQGGWAATQTYKSPERWLERALTQHHAIEEYAPISEETRLTEMVMTGLRLREGISYDTVAPVLDASKLQLLQEMNLLQLNPQGMLQVTAQGLPVLERIAAEIIQ